MADLQHPALSLTAVFVALAVGVAAGAAALGGRADDQAALVRRLEQRFDQLEGRLQESSQRLRAVSQAAQAYEGALERVAPAVVRPWLEGREVVLRPARGAEGAAAALARALERAGARVRLEPPVSGAGRLPAALVAQVGSARVVGLLGAPAPAEGGRALPAAAAQLLRLTARPPVPQASLAGPTAEARPAAGGEVAWAWQVDSSGGRLAVVVALACGAGGAVDPGWAAARLGAMAEGGVAADGERRGACP